MLFCKYDQYSLDIYWNVCDKCSRDFFYRQCIGGVSIVQWKNFISLSVYRVIFQSVTKWPEVGFNFVVKIVVDSNKWTLLSKSVYGLKKIQSFDVSISAKWYHIGNWFLLCFFCCCWNFDISKTRQHTYRFEIDFCSQNSL